MSKELDGHIASAEFPELAGLIEEAEMLPEAIVDTVRDALLLLDRDLTVRFANRSFYLMFQAVRADTLNRRVYELGDHEWDIPALRTLLEEILPRNNAFCGFEVTHDFPRIGRRRMLLNARKLRRRQDQQEMILLAIEDTTELTMLTKERDTLVREMHHRVKNNLQNVSSMLSLQALQTDHPVVKQALSDAQHRVRAIADIHECLYAGQNLADVEFGSYLRNIIGHIQTLYARPDIRIQLSVAPVVVGLERAVPLALVANEVITNSFKHAFPSQRPGTICVSLSRVREPVTGDGNSDGAGELVELVVSDDGIGCTPTTTPTGFGLQMIVLMVKQLGGHLVRGSRGAGTYYSVTFNRTGPLTLSPEAP